jgi:hypothetical protein
MRTRIKFSIGVCNVTHMKYMISNEFPTECNGQFRCVIGICIHVNTCTSVCIGQGLPKMYVEVHVHVHDKVYVYEPV